MLMQKRALASTSSGRPSQLKRPRTAGTNQTWRWSARNLVPRSWLTEDRVRRVVREEFREEWEHVKSDLVECCQSSMENALKEMMQQMSSMKNAVPKMRETVELMNDQSPHLECTNAKTTRKNDVRNFWLHIPTKLSENVFTRQKLEGKGGACISVALIDADTGEVVKSGPESSIKLDIVVLKSDFNKDDEDNWDLEEFENFMVKEREGKGSLLSGVRQVTLKGGVEELGELIFMDNSSWDRNKQFRIGLKVASGYCGNTRIREAKTDAFRVKEHRGESNKKHHPPALHDEIWRLEKIAKDGKSHQKLNKAGIYTVGDFLQHRSTDFKKLREVLGKSMTPKNWEHLIAHAMECQDLKTHSENPNVKREDAAEFSTDHQPTDLINDVVYSATDRLSAREKNHEDTIGKASSSFPSQVSERQTEIPASVQHNMAPSTCAPPVGPEAPPANAGSTAEVQSQNAYFGNPMELSTNELARPASHQPTYANNRNNLIPSGDNGITTGELPIQSHDVNSQSVMPSHVIDFSRQMDCTVNDHDLPSGQTYASMSDGHNGVIALPLPVQSQNTYFGNPMKFSANELARPASHQPTYANNWSGLIPPGDNGITIGGLPTQSHDANSQSVMPSHVIDSSRQMDSTVNEHVLPSRPTCASISDGHNDVTALPLPVQSQNTYFGNPMKFSADELARPASHQPTYANNWNGLIPPGDNGTTIGRLPTQSHNVNSQSAMASLVIDSSRQMDCTVNDHVLPSGLTCASISCGHNGVAALPLPVQSQNTYFGNPMKFSANELARPSSHQLTYANNWNGLTSPGDNGITTGGLPTQSHDVNSQSATPSHVISYSRRMDSTVNEHVLFSRPSHASISYGHNHVTALPLKVQSQNTSFGNPMNFLANELACPASHQPIPANNWNGLISPGDNGIIIGGSSTQSHDISSQDALRNQMFSPWRKMDAAVNELIQPSEPPCDPQPEGDHESDHEMENLQFNVADNMTKYSGLPDVDMSFQTPPWKDGSV